MDICVDYDVLKATSYKMVDFIRGPYTKLTKQYHLIIYSLYHPIQNLVFGDERHRTAGQGQDWPTLAAAISKVESDEGTWMDMGHMKRHMFRSTHR